MPEQAQSDARVPVEERVDLITGATDGTINIDASTFFLNANAISNERVLTSEQFERNFAIGYLSRALMAKALEGVLAATPDSQV